MTARDRLARVGAIVALVLAAGFVLILYVALLFGPPMPAEARETTVEETVEVEKTVEIPVERTIEVESAESKAQKAEKRAEIDRRVAEAQAKDAPSGDNVDIPNLPNPDLPDIPGSHCIGRGIFRVCV